MALYVKDPEVDRLATLLAEIRKTTKTEVLKQALRNEMQREEKDSFVERVVAFGRMARAQGNPDQGRPADKAFRDSLYED
jgi:antitoxin VapB